MKKYFLYSFRRRIPLFVFIFVLFLLFGGLVPGLGFMSYGDSSGIFPLLIFGSIFITFLPVFGMNYRYSLQKSDTFRQAGFKPGAIRVCDHLQILGVALVSYIASFLIYVVVAVTFKAREYHLIALLPLCLATLLFFILEYGLSYYFMSFSNSAVTAVTTILFTQLLFFFGFNIIARYVYDGFYIWASPLTYVPIVVGYFFQDLLTTGEPFGLTEPVFGSALSTVSFLIITLAIVCFGILGIVTLFFGEERSAEWAGKGKDVYQIQDILFYVGFILSATYLVSMLGTFLAGLINVFVYLLSMVVFVTIYGVRRQSFAFKQVDAITIIIVGVILFVTCLISSLVFTYISHY